jgi:sugar phosphate isomerase/epimerase
VNRRSFLETLAALGVAGGWRGGGGIVRLETIGLQLYSVRREMARDFNGTLARVSSIGYKEVEFAGYFERRPEEVKAVLDRYGLGAPSAHVPIEAARQDWARALDAANVIGHQYVVVPWLPEEGRRTLDDYKRVADEFNRLGAEARRAGIRFAYHNHDFEFAPLGGRIPYDVLLAETDSALVALELDLFWITKGGQDPITYFARHPGRFEMIHVKDSSGPPEYRQVDVGRGTIDFRRILAHQEQAGIRHAFVEHDDPADPLAFARASYDYLKRLNIGDRPAASRRRANP